MTSSELLLEGKTITTECITLVEKRFVRLRRDQLTWKPNEKTWSIAENLAHLSAYARFYHKAINHRIQTTKFRTFKENFISSPLGRSAWQSMKLGNAKNVKRRFNAPRSYNPNVHPELISMDVCSQVLADFQELLHLLEASKEINIRKAKIATSISKFVRLRIGDAFLFITYHNERHIHQALKLMDHRAFPK